MNMTQGKIIDAQFGIGGRNNAEIGIKLTFDTHYGILTSFLGWWSTSVEASEVERNRMYSGAIRKIDEVLQSAGVNNIERLINVPVSCTVDNDFVKDFRVLTEVMR